MRLVFIILLFATTAQAQFVINPYVFAAAGAGIAEAYANEKSIDLDGSAEYVSVDDADNLSQTDDKIAISAWCRPIDVTSYVIAEKEAEYLFWINATDKLEARFIDAEGDYIGRTYNTAITSNENSWQNYTATFDGTTVKLYRGGIRIDDTDANSGTYGGMTNTANNLTIGYDGANYADGRLDQVAIWDTVLSIDEIKEAMAIRDYNYHSRAANLISWWDFDEDSIGTDNITDLIGTNHGTMQSGEYADLNTHVTWPYTYQLNSNAAWDSITPMQYGFTDSIFGGFSWDLDGSAEYISVGDNDALSFTNDTISISAWVEADDLTNFVIAEKEAEYLLWINASDKLEARFIDAEGDYIGRIYNTAITAWRGRWMNVTATFNGTTVNIYRNGVDVDDTDANSGTYGSMTNTANALTIGYDGTNYANGRIGDVSIYDKVLSAAEALEIYNDHEPRDETNYDLSGNLAGYWRGYNSTNVSSGVLDQSGNGNHGTPTATDDSDVRYNYPREVLDSTGSFDFDGVDEYISVPDDNSLSFGDGATDSPFSISAWVYMDDATSFKIISKELGVNGEYTLTTNSIDELLFQIYNNSGDYTRVEANTTLTSYQGKWINVVGTYDGRGGANANQGLNLYVNGALLTNIELTGLGTFTNLNNTSLNLTIGGRPSSTFCNGKMANVSIFNKELSLAEIQELYNDESPVDITAVTFAANVVSHWRLDQTDDPTGTVTDIVGTNDGTATNMEAGDLKTDTYPTN